MTARGALRVRVEGRVQGVGFRWHTRLEARALDVSGWVENVEDGSVRAHLEGEDRRVEALVEWMGRGPSGAQVERLEREDVEPTGDVGFVIR
ncbi:MAG: acylphosphatase [Planctomycetota bacterium]